MSVNLIVGTLVFKAKGLTQVSLGRSPRIQAEWGFSALKARFSNSVEIGDEGARVRHDCLLVFESRFQR